MSWILFGLSVLVGVAVGNALWPLRRPWWLKLASVSVGWIANEMPVHVLAAHCVSVGGLARLGALDHPPGQVGAALSAASAIGLVVLAAAHRQAGGSIDGSLDFMGGKAIAAVQGSTIVEGAPFARRWLVLPWLAWFQSPEVERVAGIVYAAVEGRDLKLDVYRPSVLASDCPILVQIHGGGWIAGDRRLEARPLMNHMAARGWLCVSVNYRAGTGAAWPDQIRDVNTALSWVREHAEEYGGDPDFVAITGGSAGAHLAALAALNPNEPDYQPQTGSPAVIRACVPFYGPYDFDNSLGLRTSGEMRLIERLVVKVPLADDPKLYERASPLAQLRSDAPPFMVIHGTSDNLVFPAESRVFVERMRHTSQSAVVYVEVPRGQHAFDALPSVRTSHVVVGVERFLNHVHSLRRRIPTRAQA